MNKKEHWENVFANKQQNEVSWYQPIPKPSIDFFEKEAIHKSASIIDIGSGDSYFIDYLVNNDYKNIYALDISENALNRLKNRLKGKNNTIHFINSDITEYKPDLKFDYWHDRAVFHFLTSKEDIEKYCRLVASAIDKDGKMMIATFSKTGPLKCSALPITQYDTEDLVQLFSDSFSLLKSETLNHPTPFETTQNFTFCLFQKK